MDRQKTATTKNFLTPGTISAFPSSLHSATLALICSRTSPFISPVSPEGDTANVKMNFTRTWIMQVIHKTVGNDLEFCYSSRKPWWSGRSLVTSKCLVMFFIALFHSPTKKKKKEHFTARDIGRNKLQTTHVNKTKSKNVQKLLYIPEKRARNPCVLLLMTSISCKVTVWTTSFLFCISPSGHWTNLVWNRTVIYSVYGARYAKIIVYFSQTFDNYNINMSVFLDLFKEHVNNYF